MSPPRRLRRQTKRGLIVRALVLFGLVVFVLVTYVVIVVGGGALFGHLSAPQLGLSVLATAVVALAFDPVQKRLETTAARMVDGGQPAPYEVLRRFSETVTGSYPADELPSRMARVLANGTGAEWAQVWVTVAGDMTLAATWPPGAVATLVASPVAPPVLLAGADNDVRSMPVRHAGDLLGLLVVKPRLGASLTTVEERLFAGLASQAGLVLRGTALRVQLSQRLTELAVQADELRASRQRVVDAQDEARRLLERDIHDGAQQHLVALAVNLRLAHVLSKGSAVDSADDVVALLDNQHSAAIEARATLVRLSQGIYPPLLGERGLADALTSALKGTATPLRIDVTDVGRYASEVEAAAYFSTLEAVQNAAKHAGPSVVRVSLAGDADCVSIVVDDDGVGFDQSTVAEGRGLINMRDRVESVGGNVVVDSQPGRGTRINFELPVVPLAAAQSSGS